MIKVTASIFYVLLIIFFACEPMQDDVTDKSSSALQTDYMFLEKFQEGIFPTANYTDTADATIISTSPDQNIGAASIGVVGIYNNFDSPPTTYRHLIKFNIKGYIPKSAKVTKAFIILYMAPSAKTEISSKGVYALTKNFIEGTNFNAADGATWNTYDGVSSWTTPGGDYNPVLLGIPAGNITRTDYYTFEISASTVQNWVDDSSLNFGVLIKNVNEDLLTNQYSIAASNEATTVVQKPMLLVYYNLL